ncbi:hypothetical protein CsSME_00042997 [Camellia sinensis var. sinensis]
MKRVFGVKKDKQPSPSIHDASDRINKRSETVDEKIKKLDAELARYEEQIKKTRPAMRVLKQKRTYEGQRDMLYNQTFNLDQVEFASEGIKDAKQTMSALKSANKKLKKMTKTLNEIQESLGRSYDVPDHNLDALEADVGMETEGDGVPAYLHPDLEGGAHLATSTNRACSTSIVPLRPWTCPGVSRVL